MTWKPADSGKPHLAYDEKEVMDDDGNPKIDKKKLAEMQKEFTEEIKSGIIKPEPEIPHQPNVTIFDSRKGYIKK